MKATKKLVNQVDQCVDESLQGVVALHPGLGLLRGHRVILRTDYLEYKASGRVCCLTGGGSGHEPSFYGLVGRGLMTGAIHGPIFASPGCKTILAAIRAVGENHPAGVLIVYNNYTGDRLNFGQAIERAKNEGIKVDSVVVGEDCAMMSKDKTTGRRGLAGSAIIMKILCSLAEEGKTLEELIEISKLLVKDIGTLGVCLSPCSLPGGPPLFQIGPDEMELGLGLHGEAGVKRTKLMSAHDTITTMIEYMTSSLNSTAIKIPPGSSVAILLNNLGSTSALEMNILAVETINYLEKQGHKVDRAYSGSGVTSQEMGGFSLTIFLLDDMRKRCLDSPTTACAWPRMNLAPKASDRVTSLPVCVNEKSNKPTDTLQGCSLTQDQGKHLYHVIAGAATSLLNAEEKLNHFDHLVGDGDCGSTLKAGAQGILKQLGSEDSPGLPLWHPYNLFLALADIVEDSMGGSSGALYSLFLTACARPFLQEDWKLSTVLHGGITALCCYGGAQPGDRTMIDPLDAAYQELKKDPSNLEAAVKAAEEMSARSASMVARAGRASYVEPSLITQPDPGAAAVALWLRAALVAWKSQ